METETVVRLRAARVVDPYDPDSSVEDWERASRLTVEGFVSSVSSLLGDDAVRAQVVTGRVLTVYDPAVDVRVGDRISAASGLFRVTGIPTVDRNPFTGWQPTLVAQLEEVRG